MRISSKPNFPLLTLIVSYLVACGNSGTSVMPDAETVVSDAGETSNSITEIACNGDAFDRIGATCGLFTVDEERGIRIGFARLPSLGDSNEPPLVVLVGGPGPSGVLLQVGQYQDGGTMRFVRDDREVLLVDYRGVGLSEPFIGCAPPSDPTSLAECGTTVDASTLSFDDFRSAAFARDIAGLIEELEMETVVLWGGSYGTRLALTMMRDVPTRISHVVLDGVFPPEVNGFSQGARAPLAGLAHAVDACAQNTSCQNALGDLRPKLTTIATAIQAHSLAPKLLQTLARLGHHRAGPLLIHTLSSMSLDQIVNTLSSLADVDYRELNGNDDPGLSSDTEMRAFSFPMALGVVCSEEAPFVNQQPLDTTRHNLGSEVTDIFSDFEGGAPFLPSQAQGICLSLGIGQALPIEIAPIESDIPTLLFSGGLDMQTSPEWGELAASSLTASTHLVFPLSDHVVTQESRCAQEIMAQFLRFPTKTMDTSCLDSTAGGDLVLATMNIVSEFQ